MPTPQILEKNYSDFVNRNADKLLEYLKITEFTPVVEQSLLSALDWFEKFTGWALGKHKIRYDAGYQFLVLLPVKIGDAEYVEDFVTFTEPTVVETVPVDSHAVVDIVFNLTSRFYYNRSDAPIDTSDIVRKANAIKRVML